MSTTAISSSYAALFSAMRKPADASGENDAAEFAVFLPNEEHIDAAPTPDMAARILEVGLVRYTEERQEVEKTMRVLAIVRMETHGDVEKELDTLIAKFKIAPPLNADDAMRQIKAHIDKIPPIGDLKQRMLKVFERIKELMALPDDALERLEKELQTKNSADASTVFTANEVGENA